MTITTSPATLAIGGEQQYVVVGTDADGNTVTITPVWTVVAGGGTITSGGLFTAGTAGGTFTNTIQATSGSTTVSTSVTVSSGALASIIITPNPVPMAISSLNQFQATGTDTYGNPVTVSPVWSVVAGGGTITSSGLFTSGTVGGTYANTVRATSGGISSTATVTVTNGALSAITLTPAQVSMAIGSTQQFTAEGKDADGNVVILTPVWSVVAGGGTISSSGLFTAGAVSGTFTSTVQAASGSIARRATVTVTDGVLSTITISPLSASLAINTSHQFVATGTDNNGNAVSISPVWSVVAGGGTITQGGLFFSGTVGGTYTGTIQATSGSVVSNATVTVTNGVLASLTISPSSISVLEGATRQFTVVGNDSEGNVVIITPSWSVVAGGGTIGSAGLFTASLTGGTYANTVQARSGAITGTASVTVVPIGDPASPFATTNVILTQGGSPISGATVSFAASVTGVPLSYLWSGVTDSQGRAAIVIENPSGAAGYYLVRATSAGGTLLRTWASVPISGGYDHEITLPVEGDANVTLGDPVPAGN
jgi:hypothetical protein